MATVGKAQLNEANKAVGLEDNYDSWRKDVQNYHEAKKTLQYVPDPYRKVTNEHVKRKEVEYNPITQTFTNADREREVQKLEEANKIETLAQNKVSLKSKCEKLLFFASQDRSLRYEQTYNILNFDNKLRGLENRTDYPKEKAWYFRPGKDTLANYNIISNVDMKDHHFQPPSKRPDPTKEERVRGKQVKVPAQRDYNVVTNRYLEHHDEKVALNDEIFRAEAA